LGVPLYDPSSGVFGHEAFLHLLLRETGRGIRYRDYFTLCLFRPDVPEGESVFEGGIEAALATKIAELVRATDLVGQFPDALAVLLLHTSHEDAVGVAERVREGIRHVQFRRGPEDPPRALTLSAGVVAFPRDGQRSATLLSRALRYLDQARQRGGNTVVHGG
jgi:Diguanylate cyclase, GGDEF domain